MVGGGIAIPFLNLAQSSWTSAMLFALEAVMRKGRCLEKNLLLYFAFLPTASPLFYKSLYSLNDR
jgi:hypothetical protein